ncbi:hypothetical protein ACWDUX_14385 [Streptomyces sp. NPDC003444]
MQQGDQEPTWYGARDINSLNDVRNCANFLPVAAGRGFPPTPKPDSRLHGYRRTPSGLRMAGKSSWNAAFAKAVGLGFGEVREWSEGSEWTIGDALYRSVAIRRRDAVTEAGEWRPVWEAVEELAERHGDDNVRLVVWFDD